VRSGSGAGHPLGPGMAAGVRLPSCQRHHVRGQRSVACHAPANIYLHVLWTWQ